MGKCRVQSHALGTSVHRAQGNFIVSATCPGPLSLGAWLGICASVPGLYHLFTAKKNKCVPLSARDRGSQDEAVWQLASGRYCRSQASLHPWVPEKSGQQAYVKQRGSVMALKRVAGQGRDAVSKPVFIF